MSAAPIHPPARLLFGPGPSMVEPRVYKAIAQPVVGHLDPYFFEVLHETRRMLRQVFGTKNDLTIPLSGTGSAGMETAVSNFVEPDSKFVVFTAGYFGDRIVEMGKRQGAHVIACQKPWGKTFGAQEASEVLHREKPAVVAFVHAETSTGALQDPHPITRAAREIDALVIADAVTSLGATPVNVDENHIDICYSCSQKGMSCPPGLSPFTASHRAVERLRHRKTPMHAWYLDLNLLMEFYDGKKYHHTASASLLYALHEGLAAIEDEGLHARYNRHVENHVALVSALESCGLSMHVSPGSRIPNLNTPCVPAGVDDAKVRKTLLEKHGIEIAGGFGQLAGKIFRIGLMGPLSNPESVKQFITAFQDALGS